MVFKTDPETAVEAGLPDFMIKLQVSGQPGSTDVVTGEGKVCQSAKQVGYLSPSPVQVDYGSKHLHC